MTNKPNSPQASLGRASDDAQTPSMSLHAAPVDAQNWGDKRQTTIPEPARVVVFADYDTGGYGWKIVWCSGSEDYGLGDTFDEAQAMCQAALKQGEQPL